MATLIGSLTMNQHSPGFWTTERRNGCIAIVDANGHDVTYQDDAPRFYNGEPCGSVTSRGRTSEELNANVKLIAAAPELLAACKAALHPPEYDADENPSPCSCSICVKLRSAIAKAGGAA